MIWGTGTPRREFLYVDDLADALVFLMRNYSDERIINVGTGNDLSILELAGMIAALIGYSGLHQSRSIQARWHAAQATRYHAHSRYWMKSP